MAKLNQIIAIEKGVKSQTHAVMSEVYKTVQKPELFNGLHRAYQPLDDDGAQLPPESKRVQYGTLGVLAQVEQRMAELMNITARKDWSNCNAVADLTVDGHVIASKVPVTHLLFLEKQLTDLQTFISSLPTLDPAENWKLDPASGMYRSDETRTHRTEKVAKPIVLYPATEQHPAQTQVIAEDKLVGHWHTVKLSGAMPKPEKDAMVVRVGNLLKAAKMAREAANGIDEVKPPDVGTAIFGYILNGRS